MNINDKGDEGLQFKVTADPKFGAEINSESDAVSIRPKKKKKKKLKAQIDFSEYPEVLEK